ncbi:MAG: hypothetical protein A2431_03900 [Candidatus Zambryskibacteria bacterium RIFOXYC1_FULL_39_10]|uniref:Uncharacterized protein n=1 Tax=Candidatus Zambryskibacteria bacterium RIFOXYC1_FULL_39_10 TaxID=1802779 RepID=A0A1G2V1A4_9BACT|nr:MAG: hypothetical protein A2431_03900 [Candidatus Zambryskibacteria bacterium RIFOXYC1_FULL_39_10]OHB16488.1 MAG: hypothetical protein A2605_01605 [Candidatus Zambryskibacteria bacterium RIFOXYD1_FULL_39_35]
MKNKKNILSLFILGIIMMVFVVPLFSFAQGGGGVTPKPGGGGTTPTPAPAPVSQKIIIENPFKENTIEGLINTIVNDILLPIGGVVAVLMIMWAGFLYVTAKGDPGQIKKAHDALLWAVIGAAILLGAWVISQAITTTISQLKK